jgi:acetylornithine deacetylase
VSPADEVFARLEAWVNGRATLTRGISVPPVRLGAVEGFPTSVAAFATDLPALTNWGTPYLFGPGSVHVAHTDQEFVSIAELDAAVASYVRLAESAVRSLAYNG